MRQLKQAYNDLRIVCASIIFMFVTLISTSLTNIIIAMLIGGIAALVTLALTVGPLREHEPRQGQVKKLVYELVDPWEEFR